jgi:hypothetical protein
MENENINMYDLDNKFWGLVVYDIIDDFCINGLWSNSYSNNPKKTFNEIARNIKKIKCDFEKDYDIKLSGTYNLAWIEEKKDEIVKGKLHITVPKKNLIYNVEWENEDKKVIFVGRGLRIRKNQLVVYYSKCKPYIKK